MLYFAEIGGTEVDKTEESDGSAINGHDVDQQSDEGFQSGAESVLGLTWRFTLLFLNECITFLVERNDENFPFNSNFGVRKSVKLKVLQWIEWSFDRLSLGSPHPILRVLVSKMFFSTSWA